MTNPPFLENRFPAPSSVEVDINTLITVDILDAESYVDLSTIDAYVADSDVDGYRIAYRAGVGFVSPYDGPLSAITSTTVEGYHLFHRFFDRRLGFYPWDV